MASVKAATEDGKRDAGVRLEVARRFLKELQSQFTEEHPRVKAQRQKVSELMREVRIEEVSSHLEKARRNLEGLRSQYRSDHPEVKAEEATIIFLEKGLEQEKTRK